MNRTTKAKYDLAERMLNVHIDTGGNTVQVYMAELATEAKSQLEAQNKNK